jgi:putative membrane protein
MSDTEDKYQQQILFDEPEDETTPTDLIHTQIIVDNNDYQSDNNDYLAQENRFDEALVQPNKPSWLWRILMSLLAILLVLEASDYFITGFNQTPLTTTIVAIISSIIVLLAGSALFKEFTGLRQIKRQQQTQKQALALLSADSEVNTTGRISATELCERISQHLPCDIIASKETWQSAHYAEHNDHEILQHYSRTVLADVDQKAINEIAKFSTESVVLVALSPVAVVDMLLMLWRNLRMINKVSALYGLKLSYWSRIKLIKLVFINMAYAGASEIVADMGADMLGADLLGKLSARFAQGVGAGMLTARLGLRVLQFARPIPFHQSLAQDAPKLGVIRKEIINQVTSLLKNKG